MSGRRTPFALAATGVMAVTALVAGGSAAPAVAATADEPRVVCRFDDDRLDEISGITWSRRHPGTYWLHNDSSGGTYLYAVDGRTCRTQARVRVSGIGARDLEALATGVDPAGNAVLWLADIGDNRDSWPSVRLIAVREPARLVDQQVGSTTYEFTYPDGGTNAEALIAAPDRARLWVVTKGLAGGDVWRVPLSTSRVTTAVRVGGGVGGLVTDAAMSPDGTRVVIRDYLRAQLYAAPVSGATLGSPTRVPLPFQAQGEAVTFTADGAALLVASEGERELWQAPLPAVSPATPPPSATSSAAPTGGPSSAPSTPAGSSADDATAAGAAPWQLVLAALALVAAAVVGVAAARRLRT